jgi:hypothetical protein
MISFWSANDHRTPPGLFLPLAVVSMEDQMKKALIAASVVTAIGTSAVAHPTNVPFDTRGECEAAYAASSKLDRERLVDTGVVKNNGAAQKTFNETFRCEYDEAEDAWFIVFLGFPEQN